MKIRNQISRVSKFLFEQLPMKEISKVNYKWGDLLYEFPAETRLTVYRRLDIELWLAELLFMTRRVEVFFLLEE